MSSARPMKTYGRRQPAATPSSPPGMVYTAGASSSGSVLFTPPSSAWMHRKSMSVDDSENEDEVHPPSSPSRNGKRSRGFSPPIRLLTARDSNRPEPELRKQVTLKGFFAPIKRLRVSDLPSLPAPPIVELPAPKRVPEPAAAPRKLHQLQFMTNAIRTCPECSMSYLRGSDDVDHKRHHTRVTRGIPWKAKKEARLYKDQLPLTWSIKDEAKERSPSPELKDDKAETTTQPSTQPVDRVFVLLPSPFMRVAKPASSKHTRFYRILVLDAATPGILIKDILRTVDTVLAAPALPPRILARCKLFLAITACEPPAAYGSKRRGPKPKEGAVERVVSAVVAQPIKWAMRVLRDGEEGEKVVDSGDGVVCDRTPLPTPLGIHRMFTVPAYRGCGLAAALLNAAASETVYGCRFDPRKGEIAFSQPTESGRRLMERWGDGRVRVFVDDESQL